MTERALVFGGAGPVGAALCRRLLALNHEVFCIDSGLFAPTPDHFTNLASPAFHYLRADLRALDHTAIESFAPSCRYLFNFCGPARYGYYVENPDATAATFLAASSRSIAYCKANGSRLILASSSEVYGSGSSLSDGMSEAREARVIPGSLRSVYAASKLLSEAMAANSATDFTIIRLFNIYGPNASADDDRVIPRMLRSIRSGEAFPVYGDGSQVRSYLYIDDLLDALMLISLGNQQSGLFNIGNPEPVSVIDLGNLVGELIGKPFLFNLAPQIVDDVAFRVPDIVNLTQKTGWKPKVTLRTGLERCVRIPG